MDNKFPEIVQHATRNAIKSFNSKISPLTAPSNRTLRLRLAKDYDGFGDYSVESSLGYINADPEALLKISETAPDFQTLYRGLCAHVAECADQLFFETNDLPTARMRNDLFAEYILHLRKELQGRKSITDVEAKQLDQLAGCFDVNLAAYLDLRQLVQDITNMQTPSLVQWAAYEIQKAHGKKALVPEAITAKAREIYSQILTRTYAVKITQEVQRLPCMVRFLSEATRISMREVQNELGSSFVDTPSEQIEQLVADRFEQKIRDVAAEMRKPTPDFMLSVNDLQAQQSNAAWGVPDDLQAMLKSVAKQAEKTAFTRLPKLYDDWRQQHALRATTSDIGFEKLPDGYLSRKHIENQCRNYLHAFENKLESVGDFVLLAKYFDALADMVMDDVTFDMDQSVGLTFLEEYTRAFAVNLKQAMTQRDLPVLSTLDSLSLCQKKFGYYREASEVIADWCTEATEGAYSSFGAWGMFTCTAALGKHHHTELTQDERKTTCDQARDFFYHMLRDRGIAPDLCDAPLIPLLHEKCVEQVMRGKTDLESAETRFRTLFSDKKKPGNLTKHQQKTLQSHLNREQHASEKETLALLDNVVAMFEGGAIDPESGEIKRAPVFDPVHLDAAMEWLAPVSRGRLN